MPAGQEHKLHISFPGDPKKFTSTGFLKKLLGSDTSVIASQ